MALGCGPNLISCWFIWSFNIQCKMTELQHNLAQQEHKQSPQFKEIKSVQDQHGKSLRKIERNIQNAKRTSRNLVLSLEKQKNILMTTTEKQRQMRKDVSKYSEDLLKLHTLYAKHYTYPQTYVDKAKDELKYQFDIEKGKVFKTLYEEKLSRLYEMFKSKLTVHGNLTELELKCKSPDHILSGLHLTEKLLKQKINDLKMTVNRWMETSRSALSSLQRLILQQASEIAEFKPWTVRHIQEKLTSNQKFLYATKKYLNRYNADITALNDTINTMKSSCCSYVSFAFRSGITTMSKCRRRMSDMNTIKYTPYVWRWLCNTLIISISLTLLIYLLWTDYLGIRKVIVNKWMKEKIKPLQTKTKAKYKLENSLCVIGFGPGIDNQKYVQLASELVGSGCSLHMKRVFVNDALNLQTIPPSKVVVVFVDYNERNLIIEEEEEGLKRQTLLMLKSTGADITVVYCWELSSKHLDEGHLFAPKLSTINRMKELRDLRERNSIFSIYDKFNETQKEVFRSKLMVATQH